MFRMDKWYYYQNNKERDCRYKFTYDVTGKGKVYIIIAHYSDGDVQAFAHDEYDDVQQIMRNLTMTDGEAQ